MPATALSQYSLTPLLCKCVQSQVTPVHIAPAPWNLSVSSGHLIRFLEAVAMVSCLITLDIDIHVSLPSLAQADQQALGGR